MEARAPSWPGGDICVRCIRRVRIPAALIGHRRARVDHWKITHGGEELANGVSLENARLDRGPCTKEERNIPETLKNVQPHL